MKLKIVDFKKFIRMIIIIMSIIVISLFIGLTSTYSKGEVKYKEQYISTGDTLWSIAKYEANNNKYYEEKDIREIVQEIKNINNIGNKNLEIGQKILIPTM